MPPILTLWMLRGYASTVLCVPPTEDALHLLLHLVFGEVRSHEHQELRKPIEITGSSGVHYQGTYVVWFWQAARQALGIGACVG